MENDILDSLIDIGYEGPLTDELALSQALDEGPKSLEFTKLVHILAEELKTLCGLEETVNLISSVDESSSFVLELSSFLKELKCPYNSLVTGYMSSRLQSKEDRILLLDYLVSELMAARMVQVNNPKKKRVSDMEIVMQESPTAKDLKDILIALDLKKPPPNITPEMLFAKVESKLKDTIAKEGQQLVGKPLYNKAMTQKDWTQLEDSYTAMYEDYQLRRETLLTRLDCTIQSFVWSDRLKSKKDAIQSAYRPIRDTLKMKPNVKLSDFLAARTTLLAVEKTSSANVRKNTQSHVNKVIMGEVPDRGGRPNEAQPPPPEMPSWQQRTTATRGRGGPGAGGGRGGGDRGSGVGDRGGRGVGDGGVSGGSYRGGRGVGGDWGVRGGSDRGGRGVGDWGVRGGSDRGGRGVGDWGIRGGSDRGGRGVGDWGVRGGGGRGAADRGHGGRVQGGYSQATRQEQFRPQFSPVLNRQNYQTYEVPPGGYNNGQERRGSFENRGYDMNRGYCSNRGYDNSGGYNNRGGYVSFDGGFNQGGSFNQNQGYQIQEGYNQYPRGGYRNEHDDRIPGYQGRVRGGYRGRR